MNRKHNLTRHLKQVHSTKRPFSCWQCQSRFRVTDDLTKHIKYVHSESKPLSCPQCTNVLKFERIICTFVCILNFLPLSYYYDIMIFIVPIVSNPICFPIQNKYAMSPLWEGWEIWIPGPFWLKPSPLRRMSFGRPRNVFLTPRFIAYENFKWREISMFFKFNVEYSILKCWARCHYFVSN